MQAAGKVVPPVSQPFPTIVIMLKLMPHTQQQDCTALHRRIVCGKARLPVALHAHLHSFWVMLLQPGGVAELGLIQLPPSFRDLTIEESRVSKGRAEHRAADTRLGAAAVVDHVLRLVATVLHEGCRDVIGRELRLIALGL